MHIRRWNKRRVLTCDWTAYTEGYISHQSGYILATWNVTLARISNTNGTNGSGSCKSTQNVKITCTVNMQSLFQTEGEDRYLRASYAQ